MPTSLLFLLAPLFGSRLYMLTEELPGWWRVVACVVLAVGVFRP